MIASLASTAEHRAAVHRALGDARRLRVVDALQLSDHTVSELGELTGLASSLLAFHLQVLDDAGVIVRTPSEGDARRRYVSLDPAVYPLVGEPPRLDRPTDTVLFVCTANSARSQLAALLWRERTGGAATSAGTEPGDLVHPGAVAVARRYGLDLRAATPRHYRDLDVAPDLVVSVCDRVRERPVELTAPRLHWSIPDPVPRGRRAFEDAFTRLAVRVDRLVRAA